jgi:iron complex transport system ATP-binding protein
MSMAVISLKDLNFSYGDQHILKHLDLNLEKGLFYSILGPNGSGKTTLLKNIQKILRPARKCIYLNGEDVRLISTKEMSRKLAIVPQEAHVEFDFTVLDMVLMGRAPYLKRFETESSHDLSLAKNAMEITDTWKFKDKSVKMLSGGELQRVFVSRAMVQDTDILLLDEPVSHLDIHHQISILNTVAGFCRSKGITVLAVLHDINLASEFSDSLILMHQGEIMEVGSPDQVITELSVRTLYDLDCLVIKNPLSGKPHVIPTVIKR